eukprot:TRINITY_DN41626_c0_g1_i1.p1 TRINITY_DN41626_c0_g1~~TRINITY_DN41626_c0_g1_i1.p1  ORF type:complete len:209 (-),score=0.39 TRINITY_DN41626_c0_g1_i1:174-800(-)
MAQIVAPLPFWWRFLQCGRRWKDTGNAFPHLVNAGKYSTSLFMILFATLHYYEESTGFTTLWFLWLLSALVKTGYSLWWDYVLDWGLFSQPPANDSLSSPYNGSGTLQRPRPRYPFLRAELMYSWPGWYYTAMFMNLILRCLWVVPVFIKHPFALSTPAVIAVYATLELLRRGLWNFFRLENEQINNTEGYRAVRDVPLPFVCSTIDD